MEEACDVAEALLVICQASNLRCRLLLADGIELEVLTIHGDVGSQSLQVQITQVSLEGHEEVKIRKTRI